MDVRTAYGVGFERGHEGATVEADAGTGVLRGETDRGGRGYSVGAHLLNDIGDVGLPVAHADVNEDADFFGEQLALLQGQFSERALANQRVTMPYLFDDVVRHGPAADDVAEVGGDVVESLGSAVGEE